MAEPIEYDDADLQPINDDAPVDKAASEPVEIEPKSSTLDDAISKALDGAESEEKSAADRARDDKGRFAAKTESEANPAPVGTSAVEPVVSTEPAPNAQPEVSEGHFRGWSPEQRQAFQALPPEAQKVALEVVKGRDAFYTERLTEYDQAVRATAPLVNAVQPHLDRIRTVTQDPSAYVAHVLEVDRKLQFAPYAEKVQLLSQLAQNIGVPFAQPQPEPFVDPLQPGGEAYPVIHDLRTQQQQLQQQVAQYRAQIEAAHNQQTTAAIQSFAAEKAPDGQPKYPHFDRVRTVMGQMMASGQAQTLAEAYTLAVKPINDAVAAELAARQKAADAAQKAVIEKAKKARPIRSTGMSPGGAVRSAGLDAVLDGALSKAGFS